MQAVISTPIGKVGISVIKDSVTNLDYVDPQTPLLDPQVLFARKVAIELIDYFDNPNYTFDLPLAPQGTVFQIRVWQALATIPSGAVKTYGELAKQLHSNARAIGNACRANPIPIIIPCHRVIAASSLGGYAGDKSGRLISIKHFLLHHESRNQKIPLGEPGKYSLKENLLS